MAISSARKLAAMLLAGVLLAIPAFASAQDKEPAKSATFRRSALLPRNLPSM